MMSSNREKLLVVNSMEPSVYCTPIHSEFTVYIHSEFTVIHSEFTVFTLSLLYSP